MGHGSISAPGRLLRRSHALFNGGRRPSVMRQSLVAIEIAIGIEIDGDADTDTDG